MPDGRVNIAYEWYAGDGRFEWEPTWTRIDDTPNLVSGFDINRGKQTEVDSTDTSTATVYINDRDGTFRPDAEEWLGMQIMLQVWDPVAEEWVPQFRGWIDHFDYDIHPATRDGQSILTTTQIHCVDIFGLLGRLQMDVTEVAGNRVFGNNVPAGNEGVVFYEDSSPGDGSGFDDRIIQILDDCGLPALSPWYVVFTGNVDLLEGLYDVGDSPMVALEQAISAEMPGLGQHYSDKRGRYVAHGRKARFDPVGVWTGIGSTNAIRDAVWKFRRWKAGDAAANEDDPPWAQIRPPLAWTLSRDKIRNVGYAYPKQTLVASVWQAFPENLKPGQMFTYPGVNPIDRQVWSAENLLVKAGTTTGNTGAEEAKLYGQFWASVLRVARVRVDQVTFKSISTAHPFAAETWALMLNADISDIVELNHSIAGGSGIWEDFYVEGSQMKVRSLNPDMDMVEVTFNLSPAAYYDDDMGLLG